MNWLELSKSANEAEVGHQTYLCTSTTTTNRIEEPVRLEEPVRIEEPVVDPALSLHRLQLLALLSFLRYSPFLTYNIRLSALPFDEFSRYKERNRE